MFKIFRRQEPCTPAKETREGANPPFSATVVPQPDVIEGNGEADWEMWERAVAEMDATLHAPTGQQRNTTQVLSGDKDSR
jgi:hypothetical protein